MKKSGVYLERVKTTANNAQMTPTPSPISTPNDMTPKQVKNHTTCKSMEEKLRDIQPLIVR